MLLAGSAALLVGLGLGLQQIFQDFMSGVTILFEGTLKVDDIVEIRDEIVGKVKEVGLRTTKIETRDNIKSDIRYKINDAFKVQGVQIPFPQRDVHIKSSPGG